MFAPPHPHSEPDLRLFAARDSNRRQSSRAKPPTHVGEAPRLGVALVK
jgi:hypothetical protein